MPVISVDELPRGENSSIFNGHEHDAPVCFFLSEHRPSTGPSLHRHEYEEVVPAGTPHKFLSRGETHRQISIHPVPRMETEWLE